MMRKHKRLSLLLIIVCLTAAGQTSPAYPSSQAIAAPTPPPTWDILADSFESGSLDAWQLSSPTPPGLSPGDGYGGSAGLAVPLSSNSSYIYQTDLARAEEAYLTFWLIPTAPASLI